jgi:hypothetical protein
LRPAFLRTSLKRANLLDRQVVRFLLHHRTL